MKGKLKLVVAVLAVVAAGAAYKFVLAAPAETKSKVDGQVYVLPKEFLVNLADGRYAKLTVALVLDEGEAVGSHTPPPEGFGPLEQEALVRDIVTDALTGASAGSLTSEKGRNAYEDRIRAEVDRSTDVEAHDVLFTDLVVQ